MRKDQVIVADVPRSAPFGELVCAPISRMGISLRVDALDCRNVH